MGLAGDQDVNLDPGDTLSIVRPSSRNQPDPIPVFSAACQRIISRPCTANTPDEGDLVGSPSNLLSQFTFQVCLKPLICCSNHLIRYNS